MARAKFQTLTEQMFYVLLCLKEESCGMDVMDRIPAMTAGRVNVGPGTLYNLLEQFLSTGMIRETSVVGRKRSYVLTSKGLEALETEYQRLKWQLRDFERIMGKEATDDADQTVYPSLHIL